MRVLVCLAVASMVLTASVVEGAPPEPDVDGTHRVDVLTATRVPVHVYRSSAVDLNAGDLATALEVAHDALSTASVNVVWTLCDPGACRTPSPEALKVRMVLAPAGSERDSHLLGHAWIDPQSRTGELATVFFDRTRRLAGDLGLDLRVLLGRTIAHEIGHLLLATARHANSGLMREHWSRDELLRARQHDWVFAPLDAAAIRERLVRLRGAS